MARKRHRKHAKRHGHATLAQMKGLRKAWAANRSRGRKHHRKVHHRRRR